MSKGRTIQVNYLARVEGEGSLTVKLKGEKRRRCAWGSSNPRASSRRCFEAAPTVRRRLTKWRALHPERKSYHVGGP